MNFLNNLPIKIRLSIMVGILLSVALVVGLMGLNGMSDADHAVDSLYHDQMKHAQELGQLSTLAEAIRSQILLSLQHDPASPFAKMHNHAMSMHLDTIDKNIHQMDEIWIAFTGSELIAEEKRLAGLFEEEKTRFEREALEKITKALRNGKYEEANHVILDVVNPAVEEMKKIADTLLKMQEKQAGDFFDETDAAYHEMIGWVIACLVVGALIGLLLAYLTISGIMRGVTLLELSASKLAEGELGTRVEYQNQDELGRIAKAFNTMAEKVHHAMNEVKDAISRLAAAAEETSVVTMQTTEGINRQLTETSQVATAMNEMSATVQEVARNAVEAAGAAQEADNTFGQGKQVIDKVINSIGGLAGEVEEASSVIQQLETESKNIGSVLDVIKGIAEQTNLLALNAAIEAARAGEQGRGFAVVADEVRTLAGRTQASTQEIEEMISKLQAGANNAVNVMAAGKEMTQVGVEQAGAAGEALQTINVAVDKISSMNTQIASAAEEQSSVTEEINRSIVSINEVAEQSATGAQQTSEASADLARLADQLKVLVDRFKV
jgi:methyl-accepting chemotaxis protein